MLDTIRTLIATGAANGNPAIHIGITATMEKEIALSPDTFAQIEMMDKKLLDLPYTIIENGYSVLYLSDLQAQHV